MQRPIFRSKSADGGVCSAESPPSPTTKEEGRQLPLLEVKLSPWSFMGLELDAPSAEAHKAWLQGDPLPDGGPRRFLLVESKDVDEDELRGDLNDARKRRNAVYKDGREWWVRQTAP